MRRPAGLHACASSRVRRRGGYTLLEVMISAALVTLAAMAGVAHVGRGAQHADWTKDQMFARQKALSILAELRGYVSGGGGEVAADLDGFDDGTIPNPVLTIATDPADPTQFVAPDHPLSGNVRDAGTWRWTRRIAVDPLPGMNARDLRICTVRIFRLRPGETGQGTAMAECSTVVRTLGDAFPSTQVYDVYLLALDSVPGWWVYMDAIQPFVEATLQDLASRNPGLSFRAHWITKSGFGRDDLYAPYTNESRDSNANTPWTYVFPGRMPAGSAASRYYAPDRLGGRVNVDGELTPAFRNGPAAAEPFTDQDGDGQYDAGEPFTDADGDGTRDAGNPVPYAVADMHNHCMRAPDEAARFQARVDAGLEDDDEPTLRMLLDRMVAEPDRYHNAILLNLHGELLPMPPVRNYSDPARDSVARPGWRVVAHPERLRMVRVPGNDSLSTRPRWRVHAYKGEFPSAEILTTQTEPFLDVDKDGDYDVGETYQDWNANGRRDLGVPISIVIPEGDFSRNVNGTGFVSMMVSALSGGIDADGNGTTDPYAALTQARRYPEVFKDLDGDGRRQVQEPFLDLDGDGVCKGAEPWQNLDGDGVPTLATEELDDGNGNTIYDSDAPAEPFTDANANGRWDAAEPFWDADGDGTRDGPTAAVTPWRAWNPAVDNVSAAARTAYIAAYGEPFLDLDGDSVRDAAEAFFDADQDGTRDGGFRRGEMWYQVSYDAAADRTVLLLWGTPLQCPVVSSKGLPTASRLYDLEYVPCPTPSTASDTNRFSRDLFTTGSFPKNTARWVIELTLPGLRTAYETASGAADGDLVDRVITFETRIGADLTTGTTWPTLNAPQNLSRSFAWFCDALTDVPYSERYQFMGDPRHCPYADTDATGASFPHGYNWFFDDFRNGSTDATASWLAFDAGRIKDGWKKYTASSTDYGRGSGHDVGRQLAWLRTAVANAEAVYTTLTGFSYYYLSVGGDVGYDSANGFANSIPMDGTPFGLGSDVFENTIISGLGTSSISGSLKLVQSNSGSTSSGIRSGGVWVSKPWLGELYPDGAYAGQWLPWGNLRAATGTAANQFHLIRRGSYPSVQQPAGTTLVHAHARLSDNGCTSFFNVGTSSPHATFHHDFRDGQTGALVEDGPELASNYNFALPASAPVSRPWGLALSGAGTWGDEFTYTTEYPRFSAQMVRKFYDHASGASFTGSGLVRLQVPGGARGGYVVVNGIDRTTTTGSAFIARYSVLSLIHSYFAAGLPSTPNRVRQLPRVELVHPTTITELSDPASVPVRWTTEWRRWDGQPYTGLFPDTFAEDEADLVYVLLMSRNGGATWTNMLDGSAAEPGVLPWIDGTGPDPARTLPDANPGGAETWDWPTPAASVPKGGYLLRVEAYRASESLHYAQHMERAYVNR